MMFNWLTDVQLMDMIKNIIETKDYRLAVNAVIDKTVKWFSETITSLLSILS